MNSEDSTQELLFRKNVGKDSYFIKLPSGTNSSLNSDIKLMKHENSLQLKQLEVEDGSTTKLKTKDETENVLQREYCSTESKHLQFLV